MTRATLTRARIPVLFTLFLVTACSTVGPGARTAVKGAGDDLLKLRSGPGLEYRVVLGLPDGTELTRRDCVTELGQQWCQVSLANAPAVTGYVSADYLSSR